jgi:hypothetical protein
MNIQSVDHSYAVRENGLIRIESAKGWILSCEEGTLLVTQPGFNRDYVLSKGEVLRLGTNQRVLVGGASDARFRMDPPHMAPLYRNLIEGKHAFSWL